jgi:hypothetical protein
VLVRLPLTNAVSLGAAEAIQLEAFH